MKWVKAPDELKSLIQAIMEPVDCQKKPMFGYPAFFINGNMFAGLFADKVFLRLSPDQVQTLRKGYPEVRNLEPMPGRPMKDYFLIPEKLYRDARAISKVVQDCAAYCRTLARKSAKPKASRKAAPGKKKAK